MTEFRYVPVVKGKTNDVKAFSRLPVSLRASTKALFDQPFFGRDENLDEHLVEFVDRIVSWVPRDQPCFIDFYPFQDDSLAASGQLAIVEGFELLERGGHCVTPTLGVARDTTVFKAVRRIVNKLGQGLCLRIDVEALDGQTDQVAADVSDRLRLLGIPRAQCDLLLDLRSVGRLQFSVAEVILDFLAVVRYDDAFRSIILAGSSALTNVTDVPMDGLLHVERSELALWDRIVFELAGSVVPVFGDYGVVNPEFFADGPRPHANAKIRYTNGVRTSYFRGHGLYRPVTDFKQYRTLAMRVMAQPYYDGPAFSVGDAYIANVAAAPGPKGYGNLSTWVLADMNHHLTVVARQMETRASRILAAGSVEQMTSLPTLAPAV